MPANRSASKPPTVLQCIAQAQRTQKVQLPEPRTVGALDRPNLSLIQNEATDALRLHKQPPGFKRLCVLSSKQQPSNTSQAHGEDQDPAQIAQVHRSIYGPVPAVAANSFYGSLRLTEVERRIAGFLAGVKQRLKRRTERDLYQVFPLQGPAISFADNHELSEQLKVFSTQRSTGTRVFVASTYNEFWRRYQDTPAHQRHSYEIIRERQPCHLYLDLEYSRQLNPAVQGDRLVDLTLQLAEKAFKGRYELEMEPTWILELDSSTSTKFSRHIIIRVPGAAFVNNAHVGAFVRAMCADAASDDPQSAHPLSVCKGEDEALGFFVDLGVYTRNRAFRLYLSSKAGKDAVLQPTGRPHKPPATARQTFMASLICNVPPDATLLSCAEAGQQNPSAASPRTTSHFHASSSASAANYGPSPYPALEEYLTLMCREGGLQGGIRSWVSFPDIGVLLYNMRHNRWCGNIGRMHKSNGIFYVVDLQQRLWYQKCYDPDCRQYRSESLPLPLHVLPPEPTPANDAGLLAQQHSSPHAAQPNGANGNIQRHQEVYSSHGAQTGEWAVGAEQGIQQGSAQDDALMAAAVDAWERRQLPPTVFLNAL